MRKIRENADEKNESDAGTAFSVCAKKTSCGLYVLRKTIAFDAAAC
jgi:hypothetical protein